MILTSYTVLFGAFAFAGAVCVCDVTFKFLRPFVRIKYFGHPPQTPAKCVYEIERGREKGNASDCCQGLAIYCQLTWRMLSHNQCSSSSNIAIRGET